MTKKAKKPSLNPVLVNVYRSDQVECEHRGSAVVVDTFGETVMSIGDPEKLTFPRSSIKLHQAIPLVESGAADEFGLTDKEIALACASHNAEPMHTETVIDWLDKLGLSKDDLECGPTLPLNEAAAHALIASGEKPTRVHQNCSGKHSGMLTVARHIGAGTEGYSEYEHPVQSQWMETLGELIDLEIKELKWERDGCGLPAVQMPLNKLAFAFARYAAPSQVGGVRGDAMKRILTAVRKHPEMIAGTNRCCSAVIEKTGGRVVVKTGAEGVFAGVVPELGVGFAIKIDDGATRGSEVALGALLDQLEVIDLSTAKSLAPWFTPEIKNSQGAVTGKIVPSSAWTESE